MKKLTDLKLEKSKIKITGNKTNRTARLIASIFSVLFSLSLIKEAFTMNIETYVLAILTVFTVLFLIFNEYHKVTELYHHFDGRHGSLFMVSLTFVVSLCMSGIGIYLWTNKTFETTLQSDLNTSKERSVIELRYNLIIDSIASVQPENTSEYKRLKNEIDYWKGRSPANIIERDSLRQKVSGSQRDLNLYFGQFKQETSNKVELYRQMMQSELNQLETNKSVTIKRSLRANYISLIFFIMVVITEFVIVFITKGCVTDDRNLNNVLSSYHFQRYEMCYKILTDVLMRKNSIEKIDDVKYNPFFKSYINQDNDKNFYKETNLVWFLFKDLGILNINGEDRLENVRHAQKLLRDYYETILWIDIQKDKQNC